MSRSGVPLGVVGIKSGVMSFEGEDSFQRRAVFLELVVDGFLVGGKGGGGFWGRRGGVCKDDFGSEVILGFWSGSDFVICVLLEIVDIAKTWLKLASLRGGVD